MAGPEPTPPHLLLSGLKETVDHLALPGEAQVAWLSEQRLPVNELGLEFADAVPQWLPALSAAELLDDVALQRVLHLDAALEAISGQANAELWTANGLCHAGEWNVIRTLACRAATELERCAMLGPEDA